MDEREQPVGYIFTRTFGKVGFFGPFGVVPRAQASHVGKALVEATVRYMERVGCTTIGLETMPETAYNLGLYAKLGFRLFTLTLRLHKEVGAGPRDLPANVEVVTKPDDALLARVREISSTLESGLDQSKEVGLLRKYPLGSVLTYGGKGGVRGFALLYHFPDTVGIAGGMATNVIAEQCRIEVSYHPLPGADPRAIHADPRRRLAALDGLDEGGSPERATIDVGEPIVVPPLQTPPGTRLERALLAVLGDRPVRGAPFATDGPDLAAAGVASVVCGPGDLDQADQANESIDRRAFERGADVVRAVVERLCIGELDG